MSISFDKRGAKKPPTFNQLPALLLGMYFLTGWHVIWHVRMPTVFDKIKSMINKIETSTEPAFTIVGIGIRTTNENNQAQSDIGELWSRFMVEDIQGKIVDRISNDLFCVYSGYEIDHAGYYTALLGCKVDKFAPMHEGFNYVQIAEGNYQIYSLIGEIPEVVGQAWAEIWENGPERAYTFDYDRYINNNQAAEVKIYVAI